MGGFLFLKGFNTHITINVILACITTDPRNSDMPDIQQGQGSSGITTVLDIRRRDDFNNEDISEGSQMSHSLSGREANFYAFNLEIMKDEHMKNEIEDCLNYKFITRKLLERALTRKAFANEQGQRGISSEDQEIFCTLGDAVLKTVLIDLLIRSGVTTPDMITRRKIELEREENLAAIGRKIDIGPYIRLGKGEAKHNASEQPYVLAETLEAIIGAVFLDGGYTRAEERIKEWFCGLY